MSVLFTVTEKKGSRLPWKSLEPNRLTVTEISVTVNPGESGVTSKKSTVQFKNGTILGIRKLNQ